VHFYGRIGLRRYLTSQAQAAGFCTTRPLTWTYLRSKNGCPGTCCGSRRLRACWTGCVAIRGPF